MLVDGVPYRTIWLASDGATVEIIDQTLLPHHFAVARLSCLADAARAIRGMQVRGAPLIGAAAAYGLTLALREDPSDSGLSRACDVLLATRPTAVNLRWALELLRGQLLPLAPGQRHRASLALAARICDDDAAMNETLGRHGLELIRRAWEKGGRQGPVRVLTHCNAGWLATVDWGTALAPVYQAVAAGIPVHVWVDETRPRNQGGSLTAWELAAHGVPHCLIVDNAGGHLMQHGQVDLCIVGTDRTTASGDVCNKIGTYLKALAAHDNGVPFYVALPGPTIDWQIDDGLREIPIEERDADEVLWVWGTDETGQRTRVRVAAGATVAANPAFDVTPSRLVTALITERGICPASRQGLLGLYPERA